MSREVRRVPLDWKHPTEHNPYWYPQSLPFMGNLRPPSRLRGQTDRFIGLNKGYPAALADWESELADLRERKGFGWTWGVEYHLTGYQGREDSEPVCHPYFTYDENGDSQAVTVRDEDHLFVLLLAAKTEERPMAYQYMPVWDVPEESLGWCLYETVSEGTPTTPVFATAAELIDHLATVGQDYEQVPMRRAAAETLVTQGGSFGSFVVTAGQMFNSSDDADLLADALHPEATS